MRFDLVYLGAGALIGAYLRYRITGQALFFNSIPLSVLIVNVTGSFILGLTMAGVQHFGLDERYVLFLGIGFCGSYTTMSSFAFETSNLISAGKMLVAGMDMLLNVGLSIVGVFFGRALILILAGA